MTPDQKNLYDLSLPDLESLMRDWGEPPFRAKQVYRHLYVNLIQNAQEMTDLPIPLRQRLADETRFGDLRLVRLSTGDHGLTRKVLFALPDQSPVETVLMVYPDRATVCLSSQSGCPMRCTFCATGKLGFLHNLTSGQMAEQVIWAARELQSFLNEQQASPHNQKSEIENRKLTNIVYMGMGEPFNNYDAWRASVERLHDPTGFNMGARGFTVSTVGLIPGIERLADEELPVNLAISLHAPDDELRSEMMPVNKRYPVRELIRAAREYTRKTRRRVSFEYILLKEKNDFPEQARTLAVRLREDAPEDQALLFHVNLIPWNPVPGTPLSRSDRKRVLAFQAVLKDEGIPCTVRVERGTDIGAACGQLAGTMEPHGV